MTDETEDGLRLIRDIVLTMVSDKHRVALSAKEHSGAAYFQLRVSRADHATMVGRSGSHISAFKAICSAMGARAGADWRLALLEPEEGQRKGPYQLAVATNYDPRKATELLERIAFALCSGQVRVNCDKNPVVVDPMVYNFTIECREPLDQTHLVHINSDTGESLIAQIGTLYRCYGARDGVRFTVTAHSPALAS